MAPIPPAFKRKGMAGKSSEWFQSWSFSSMVSSTIIQPQHGGGTAKPFKTHVNAVCCEMYLAISHELYLKRLIVAGYDNVKLADGEE
ncbi:MAG: hypothetical protein KJ072_10995 [Verrucomicrobia bacterium]|nr:hypothetical protein [Verrucomicrobiota bacterium]